jgi:hypothetical protein
MLQDPKWDKKLKELETRDIYSLESLIAWLKEQPPGKTYPYTQPFGCALCQYFNAMTGEACTVTALVLIIPGMPLQDLPKDFNDIVYGEPMLPSPSGKSGKSRTFGQALQRAEQVRVDRLKAGV